MSESKPLFLVLLFIACSAFPASSFAQRRESRCDVTPVYPQNGKYSFDYVTKDNDALFLGLEYWDESAQEWKPMTEVNPPSNGHEFALKKTDHSYEGTIVFGGAPPAQIRMVFSIPAANGTIELKKPVTWKTPSLAPEATSLYSGGTAYSGDPVSIPTYVIAVNGNYVCAWVQTAGPTVSLSGADTETLEFVAPVVGETTELVFKLTVTDADSRTCELEVIITVEPAR